MQLGRGEGEASPVLNLAEQCKTLKKRAHTKQKRLKASGEVKMFISWWRLQYILKILTGKGHRQIKKYEYALRKSTNMCVWAVDTLSQS